VIIAFPTEKDNGFNSKVFGHFGSAPYFLMVDSEGQTVESVGNADQHHEHGQCRPVAALGGNKVDALVVGGIGGGALRKLVSEGIKVYRAVEGTVQDNLALINTGQLPEFKINMTCAGHGNSGHACSHG
jgi:predicted Fe-Mo cluster-binding NifX family protein